VTILHEIVYSVSFLTTIGKMGVHNAPDPKPSWSRWSKLKAQLDAGALILLDGGTGTEVERLVKESGGDEASLATDCKGWSCAQALHHPHVCEAVHASYINAGAQAVIANSYASNRLVLAPAGYGAEVACINESAITCAQMARGKAGQAAENVLVVGSMSCHPPEMKEGSEYDSGIWPAPDVIRAAFDEQASCLHKAGVDAIFCEMIWDLDAGRHCVAAALAAGPPVFVGLSCAPFKSTGKTTRPAKLADFNTLVTDAVSAFLQLPFAASRLVGFNVHHTKVYAMGNALRAVRAGGWHGPLGAYPDHGKFEFPHWQFHELSVQQLVDTAAEWVRDSGVQLIGGCCGIGPRHIAALKVMCDQHNAKLASIDRKKPDGVDAGDGSGQRGLHSNRRSSPSRGGSNRELQPVAVSKL